jgi:hypothetical protein
MAGGRYYRPPATEKFNRMERDINFVFSGVAEAQRARGVLESRIRKISLPLAEVRK